MHNTFADADTHIESSPELYKSHAVRVITWHTGERLQMKHFLILSQYTLYQKEKVQPRSGVVIRLLCVFWVYAPSGGQEENPSAC